MRLRFTAEMTDDSGERVSMPAEIETAVPNPEECGDKSRFYGIFDQYESAQSGGGGNHGKLPECRDSVKKGAEEGKRREIEAEIGRIPIENAAAIAPDGQPQERLYSLCHMELALLAGVSLSYRKGPGLLNRLLRRGAENGIKFRTYLDLCQRSGKKAEESAAREAASRLCEHGFDPESGKPRPEAELPPELRKEAKAETIAGAIEKINAGRQEDERVKASQTKTENPENTVYISDGDVGVRHQKEHRAAENRKDGVFVWSTNARG